VSNVVIIGGGPGGYEAALVAGQLGGNVTLLERRGLGGSAVLTDVVPSKTLIAASQIMARLREAGKLGVRLKNGSADLGSAMTVDLNAVHDRIRTLAQAQSDDIADVLATARVRVVAATGRLVSRREVMAELPDGTTELLPADVVLVAVGAHPRVVPTALPDGERIFSWDRIYDMKEMPEHLIVVGSGVTGAEFASAYHALGAKVTLISSRAQVLPSQDDDAARLIQEVFIQRGIEVYNSVRAVGVRRLGDGVVVDLADGRTVEGSHCLVAVGAIPNTADLGLEQAGVTLTESGHIQVDKVSRTTAMRVYAAGDCTNGFALASVAAMQGRIAMWHALGDAVSPLNLPTVSSCVFTNPEIATVGASQAELDRAGIPVRAVTLPLGSNARSKMKEFTDGFVKIYALPTTHIVVGAVVVSFWASELIHSLSLAVRHKLTVEQLAEAFTVYPSVSGSIAEAARRLHGREGEAVILY
jgi:dihydrolipoamide dehydrogenase